MRIALISDIHGNLTALEAILTDIERRGADRIVCLGDVAAMGPQPADCVRRVKAIGCPVVMGNTDDLLLHPPDPSNAPDDATRLRFTALRWGADRLSADDRRYLAGFQPTITVELGGDATLLCCHGSPRSFDDIVLPTTPDEEVAQWFDGVGAAVIAGGHTHVSMVRPLGARQFVNPGSVGMTFFRVSGAITANPPWAEYGLVSWTSGLADVELRRVSLDRDALLRAARESEMPNLDTWVAGWG